MLTIRTIKVPEEITDEELLEWVQVKVDRFYNATLIAPNTDIVEGKKKAFKDANNIGIQPK